MQIKNSNIIISFKDVAVSYDSTDAIENISLDINRGDYVGFAGPNGAGKTTLVKALIGLIPTSKGSIEIYNKNVKEFNDWKRIGYLPQKLIGINPLFPISVEEIVTLGLLSGKRFPKTINKNDIQKADQTLKDLNIHNLRNRMFSSLSGGQQQRVILARSIVSDPEILILDEPSTALDPESREAFFTYIGKLNKEKGTTIIMITHDTGNIGTYANKLLYLDKSIIYYGSFEDFCKSEKMSVLFGKTDQHLICHQHEH